MKTTKYLSLCLVFIISWALYSCSEDYSSPLKEVKIDDVIFDSNKGKTTILLGEDDYDKYENLTIISNSGWCNARFGRFYNNEVVIEVEENNTYDDRQAIVTITDPEDGTTLSVHVLQKQNNVILVDGSDFSIPEEGGEISIKVQSNLNYTIEKPADATWLTFSSSKTRGLSTSTIVFKADKNNSGDERKAIVKLTDSASGTSSQLTIKQLLTPIITIDKSEFTVDELGGEIKIKVNSNIPVYTKYGDVWVSDGGRTEKDNFSFVQIIKVSPYLGSENSRSTNVTFSDDDGKWRISKVVNVKQIKSLSISDSDIELYLGDSHTINYVNNTGKTVSWKSSDTSVATVNNGKVTGVGKGTATITVSTSDGNYSAKVNVTVKDIKDFISGSAGGGYAIVAGPTGTFAGYYVSCSLKNGSSKDITVNKCTIYENGSYIGAQTNYGTLKAGQSKYAEVSNRLYDITSRSYKFVWEYSYNGKSYTFTVNYR